MSDTQDPTHRDNIYDLGAFFVQRFHCSPSEARSYVEDCASLAVFSRDGFVSIDTATYLSLVAATDRLVSMWEDDDHTLVTTRDGWSIEHPLRCRATGAMARCPIHVAMSIHAEEDGYLPSPGRRRVWLEGAPPDDVEDLAYDSDWYIMWDEPR